MSTTTPTSLNGRMKKTLAFQLDRLDSILDGLAEALNGAVAEAVKETVGKAARDAVKVALDEAMAQVAVEKPKATTNPVANFWTKAKAKVSSMISQVKNVAFGTCQKVKQFGTRYLSATVLAAQSGVASIKSRTMRIGIMLGAITSCVVCLFRKDKRVIWWSAGILVCTVLMESILGTLGTLVLGGAVLYLSQHDRGHTVQPRTGMHAT
jgi:hypothetical protein